MSAAATATALLRSERIKLTSVRVGAALVLATALVGAVVAWAFASFAPDEGLVATEVFLYPTVFTAVLAAIGGILLFTSEVQHGTLAGALTAHPSRWPVAAAKAVVATGLGLLLGAIGLATGFVGALIGRVPVGDVSAVRTTVLWALLYTAGAALLGLGVGMVVRHSAAAISGLLVWWLVIEGLIVQLAPAEVVRFVPFDTGFRSIGVESDLDVASVVEGGLSNPLHASIFWVYVIVALAIGATLLVRRDVD